ncbi:uncharacterized protein CPUR_02970 [Claviceps purpurea 20.1]|uniref:Uncharacterized protein n=1 Tax=Claviceps purpurea (strain 20.1) TaxID=1111077 RepID=M1VVC4_CLAP2|nr:uncharacterized protein CPUR_02970 [Claviceps purpurea 20.1]
MNNPASDSMYALQDVPGKGKGLVATRHIPKGTRILCEEPLFTIPNVRNAKEGLRLIRQQVASLSNDQRQDYLSMRNIHTDAFNDGWDTAEGYAGIFLTNCLPAGGFPIEHTKGIFLEACRINHDCKYNALYDWNDNIKRHTVHAVRDINAGEEITVSYVVYLRNREGRQRMLKTSYHFTCVCSLCSLPDEQSQERDRKIAQIIRLEELYTSKCKTSPYPSLQRLGYLDAETRLYKELHQEDCGHPASYQHAVAIAISQGDLARGRVFAQRVVCGFMTMFGSDSPETIEYVEIAKNPASKKKLYGSSMRWKTSVDEMPQGLGPNEFEDWLWRREPAPLAPAQPMSPPSQSLFSGFADLPYRNDIGAGSFQSRYSCFLGEVVETLVAHPLDLKIRDIHGKMVELQFFTKGEGTELEPGQYQRGHTVAILNASQYVFKFKPRGIRHTDPESIKVNTIPEYGLFCINQEPAHLFAKFLFWLLLIECCYQPVCRKIFPISLAKMLALNNEVQNFSFRQENGMRSCHGCGKNAVASSMKRCGMCLSFWYCNRECQTAGWTTRSHKADCKFLRDTDLRGLFLMKSGEAEDCVRFPLNVADQSY